MSLDSSAVVLQSDLRSQSMASDQLVSYLKPEALPLLSPLNPNYSPSTPPQLVSPSSIASVSPGSTQIFDGEEICFIFQPTMEQILTFSPQWVISLFGVIGNFLVIFIYLQKRQKSPGDFPILVLAFVDLFMCTFSIIFTMFLAIFQPNTREPGCFMNLCIVGNVAFDVPYTFSCGMMCIMAVNRFLAVCRPHSYQG